MNGLLLSKRAKITVDILLVAGLVSLHFAGHAETTSFYWASSHCIVGSVLSLLIIIHIIQHWRLIKAFTKKKVILKNRITALTIFCSVLMLLSIVFFIAGIPLGRFHHVIGHVFILIVIIHAVDKSKRFISLF